MVSGSNASVLMSKILATTEYIPIKDDVSIVRAPPVSRRSAASMSKDSLGLVNAYTLE